MNNTQDWRQRFYFDKSPVRGDIIRLNGVLAEVFSRKDYPKALTCLLAQMLAASGLVSAALKMTGRLSIQMKGEGNLTWAMAECNSNGELRALAKWQNSDQWEQLSTAEEAFAQLDDVKNAAKGVMFINIEPENGQRYQSIIERLYPNLADCLAHYQAQSVQVKTLLKLTGNNQSASGIMVQKLPEALSPEHEQDHDLWPRLSMLTATLKTDELQNLPAKQILYRLYHEEDVVIPEATTLKFGCTCSKSRCLNALSTLGFEQVKAIYQSNEVVNGILTMDCQFCGQDYQISQHEALQLFDLPN